VTGRPLHLYLRTRWVPAAAAAVVVTALVARWAGEWLMSRPFLAHEQARIPVSALGALVVAGALATTLDRAHEWLERSTPAPWRRIRAAHLLVAAGLGGAALAASALSRPEDFGAPAMARGVVGLLGLGALAATVTGGRAAWIVILCYASTVYLAAPREPGGAAGVWAWPMQPTDVRASYVTAGVLLVAGIAVHAVIGTRAAPTAGAGNE
jgi:hypothetical protein